MWCPNCGNELRPGARFCGRCRYDLQAALAQLQGAPHQQRMAQQTSSQWQEPNQFPFQPQYQRQIQPQRIEADAVLRKVRIPQWVYIAVDCIFMALVTFMPWISLSISTLFGLSVGAAYSLPGIGWMVFTKLLPLLNSAAALTGAAGSGYTVFFVILAVVSFVLWGFSMFFLVRATVADARRLMGERDAFAGYVMSAVSAGVTVVVASVLVIYRTYGTVSVLPITSGCWLTLILGIAAAILRKRYPVLCTAPMSHSKVDITDVNQNSGMGGGLYG